MDQQWVMEQEIARVERRGLLPSQVTARPQRSSTGAGGNLGYNHPEE
jgi:hypothetical protein